MIYAEFPGIIAEWLKLYEFRSLVPIHLCLIVIYDFCM